MNELDFSALFQERLKITNLPDGSHLTLINSEEMGVEDYASFISVKGKMDAAQRKAEGANNEQAALKQAKEIDRLADDILRRLALDGISDDALESLRLGQKSAIVARWSKYQDEIQGKTPKNGTGQRQTN